MTVIVLLSLFSIAVLIAALTNEPVTAVVAVLDAVLFFYIARREIRA